LSYATATAVGQRRVDNNQKTLCGPVAFLLFRIGVDRRIQSRRTAAQKIKIFQKQIGGGLKMLGGSSIEHRRGRSKEN